MKLILIGVVSVAILLGGFFALNAYIYHEKQADETGDQTVPSVGKLDPRVACEGALAYMTFSTGEEADLFVESCIAGDHPEVIERYRDSLNVDGAVI